MDAVEYIPKRSAIERCRAVVREASRVIYQETSHAPEARDTVSLQRAYARRQEAEDMIRWLEACQKVFPAEMDTLDAIRSAHINLCDSCKHTYPECPSTAVDALFGKYDNICACAKFQRKGNERKKGKWVDKCVRDWRCSECGCEIQKVRLYDGYYYKNLPNFCPNCGVDMRGDDNG